MLQRNSLLASLIAAVTLAPAGCNKTVGDALRPDDHTGASAAGAALDCAGSAGRIKPLIVDWDPDARVDLEAAMQGSVVVVRYECPSVEILPGCTVDGSYSYAGVSRREQVIQLQNMDDVHANIPISSAKVGIEIESGRAIDLATVLVGRRSTTVVSLSGEALTGECEGATHFIRSASLGAFSMATGSKGKAAVVGELFGFGAGASSDSTRAALNSDGSLESCMTSDPSSPTPPAECQAPIRIELVPIGSAPPATTSDGERKAVAVENPCLPGYVYADEMCVRPSAGRAHLCEPDDQADCQAQCDKGNAQSCFNLGRLLDAKGDQAEAPLRSACEADIAEACTLLGEILWYDVDEEDPSADQQINRAFKLVNKGCEGGDGYGCELAGDIFSEPSLPSYDEAKAYALYTRACDLGSGVGCSFAAERLFEGKGTSKDVEQGLELLLRSCQAGSYDECGEIGGIFNNGKYGLERDVATAAKFYGVACLGEVGWCEMAGDVATQAGETELAKRWYQRDCEEDPDSDACSKR